MMGPLPVWLRAAGRGDRRLGLDLELDLAARRQVRLERLHALGRLARVVLRHALREQEARLGLRRVRLAERGAGVEVLAGLERRVALGGELDGGLALGAGL